MKFADITSPPPPKTTGKVHMTSMTKTEELTNPQLSDKTFEPPRPSQMVKQDDDDEFKDLPF